MLLGGAEKANFVVGWYSDTLVSGLREDRGMSPAFYVDVDSDLYTSSIQALDWLFASGLVMPGTLVGYDDFWVNPCSKGGEQLHPLQTSEGRAHREIAEKYNVQFRCVAGSCHFEPEAAPCES